MGPNNIKVEPHDEWKSMVQKLENMPDERLQAIADGLKLSYAVGYYAEGITMDSWAQAVYSEMDRRSMKYVLPQRLR